MTWDWWPVVSASDLFVKVWPAIVVLGFFFAARRRMERKLLFVTLGIVIGFASQYLAIVILVFLVNAWMSRPVVYDANVSSVVAPFAAALVLDLIAPLLVLWGLYGFWMRKQIARART